MLPNVPFDPTRDIAHIGLIAKVSELVVNFFGNAGVQFW